MSRLQECHQKLSAKLVAGQRSITQGDRDLSDLRTGIVSIEEIVDGKNGVHDVSDLCDLILILRQGRAHMVVPGALLSIHHGAVLPSKACSKANEAC